MQDTGRPTNSTLIAEQGAADYRATVICHYPSTGQDRIVFSVIEHTADPEQLLRRTEALREPLARFYGAAVAFTRATVAPAYCLGEGWAANNR